MRKNLRNWLNENVIFPIGDVISGTCVSAQLKIQRRHARLSSAQLKELQAKKLQSVLENACKNCSFYNAFEKHNTSSPFDWVSKFPVITKHDINKNLDAFISRKFKKSSLIKYETSGSSGVKTTVYVDKKEQSIFRAILIVWWEWTGYFLGKPIIQTGMSPRRGWLKSIKDFVTNTAYFPAFNFDESLISKRLKKFENIPNYHFGGYASSLYVIAQIAEKNNLNLSFDGVISWGDKMFDHYKKKIESVFNTKVYENYGCNEGLMVGQKVDLDYFYIYTPNVLLEILDENNNQVEDGEIGRVIVTKLDGYAMPLIRYDTGDLAIRLPESDYPNERLFQFPLLKKVIGRNTDIIKTKDGKILIVHTFTGIFEFYSEIIQFKVIQENLEFITIEYIPASNFNYEILEKIEKELHEKTGSKISIRWKQVDRIQNSRSGKPQIIENKLLKKSLAHTT